MTTLGWFTERRYCDISNMVKATDQYHVPTDCLAVGTIYTTVTKVSPWRKNVLSFFFFYLLSKAFPWKKSIHFSFSPKLTNHSLSFIATFILFAQTKQHVSK